MLQILLITLPFFAVIGLGCLARSMGWMNDAAVRPINTFVFNFAMPALVINALAPLPFADLLDARFLSAWLAGNLALYLVGFFAAVWLFRGTIREAAMFGQASSIGNLGFLALPLLLSVVGEAAAVPFANAFIVDLVIIIPITIGVLESSGGGSFLIAIGRSLRGAVVNPFFLAIFAALLLSATGIGLPGPSKRFAEFLAGAAGPAALFSLGVSLAGRRIAGDIAPIALMTTLKLAVHPLLAWGLMSAFNVNQQFMLVGIVLASMPVAGNLFVIAEQYGVLVQRLSAAILISTMLAIVTVSIVLDWTGLALTNQ